MSMLSSQCDELRQVAQVYRNLGKYATEQMLLEAADTILELRDDLQRANSSLQDAEHDESVAWDRVRKAEDESAKLRELARKMLKPFYWAQSGYEVCLSDEEDREIRDMLRELGVEEN